MNVQLPRTKKLQSNWYRKPGFNVHSNILYDFLVCNNLLVADFLHPQNPEYTYFCHKNSHYTWIDHILTTSHNVNTIEMCEIIPELDGNVSDHLPLRMLFTLDVNIPMKAANSPVASLYKPYMNPETVGTIRFFDDFVLVRCCRYQIQLLPVWQLWEEFVNRINPKWRHWN